MANKHIKQEESDQKSLYVWLLRCGWVLPGKSVYRAGSPVLRSLSLLERLRRLLVSLTGFELPAVQRDWDTSLLGDFCSGVIEKKRCHPWVQRLLEGHACLKTRTSVASTLFLFRKCLVKEKTSKAQKKKMIEKYIEKMCTAQSPPPLDVQEFTERTLRSMFKVGWDSGWDSKVEGFVLPTKSCLENRLCDGGARGLLDESRVICDGEEIAPIRAQFKAFIRGDLRELPLETLCCIVPTGGKERLVSKFSYFRSFLSPLHRLIYDRLSDQDWLLRGEATPEVFSDFFPVDGEVFVSGDYESATDNLNIELSILILRCLRRTSLHVPYWVWDQAEACMHNRFGDNTQKRGQLMGSLISFPLLCISNYLAFKFSIPRDVPVKINGDDIVFRCTEAESRSWFDSVSNWGLTVSRGKTIVARSFFSLNSSFFLSRRSTGVSFTPFIRSSCLFGKAEVANEISGRVERSIVNGKKFVKEQVHATVLRECTQALWSSQRSLKKLGVKVNRHTIKSCRLEAREEFYTQHAFKEKDLPLQMPGYFKWSMPAGWSKVPAGPGDVDDPLFMPELVEQCWSEKKKTSYAGRTESTTDEYWRILRETSYKYVKKPSSRWARLAGMTSIESEDFLSTSWAKKEKKQETVWRRIGGGGAKHFAFVSGGLLEDQLPKPLF